MLVPRNNRLTRRQNWEDDFFAPFFNMDHFFRSEGMRVDLKDKGDAFELEAELPGVPRENIEVSANDGVLTISANVEEQNKRENEHYVYSERRSGRFQRSFNLDGIVEEKISAAYDNGVLRLTLPKREEANKSVSRRIEIQ